MLRYLMASSALALATAPAAQAVEWDVTVSGYFESFLGFASSDVDGVTGEDYDGVDVKQDAEVHFQPSITLDNGLKFGADIQLEGNTDAADQIDQSLVFIDGDFGRVLLGSENSAGYLMHYGAPDVTFLNVNSGSLTKFIPFSGTAAGLSVGNDIFLATLGATFIENGGNDSSQRITYFTPRFSGFQLGVSYARDASQDTSAQLNLNGDPLHNLFDVGANYVETLGGVDVVVSGRWGLAQDDQARVPGTDIGKNPQIWAAGLNLGYAGVTMGGSFAEQNNAGVLDGQGWDAGIAYTTGPWGISFTYMHGRNVDDENQFALRNDEKLDQFLLGVSYTLAEGVALNGYGAYVKFNEQTGDAGGPNAASGDDVDGFVIGTGLQLAW